MFAGAGGLGIEALSRGARFCLFVEVEERAARALQANLADLFEVGTYEVAREDFRKLLPRFSAAGRRFDLVLADPPYRQDFLDDLSAAWLQNPVLRPDGIFALEHSKRENFEVPENLSLLESRRYGDTILAYYRPSA